MPIDVQILRDNLAEIQPKMSRLSEVFYRLLFEENPDIEELFKGTRMEEQRLRFQRSIKLVIENLDNEGYLSSYLMGLGHMHKAFGATESHYQKMKESFLRALAEINGPGWNDDIRMAWSDAYDLTARLMLEGSRLN